MQDSAAPQRTSTFTYAGLTRALQSERHENASASHIITKTYRYDALDRRTGLATVLGSAAADDDVAGTLTYGYELHGSVSLLLQDTGNLKASYAYEPYSKEDVGLSRGDRTSDKQNPFNPFRYTGDRLDSGNGGIALDNGTRLFSPDFKRSYQRDSFENAGADARLTADLWNANRYALAGGNPLNFVEVGGHFAPIGITLVDQAKLL